MRLYSVAQGGRAALDEEALIAAYRASIGPLYRFVSRRVGGDTGLAEDLVQETWMRALDHWPAHGVPDEPLAWLIRVARNTLVSHFRRIRPVATDPEVLDLESSDFRPETPGAATAVGWGLARLRRAHAELLEAFYFDGRTTRELAESFALSERAVEGRLRRARAKLRKQLLKVMPEAGAARRRTVREVI